MAGGVFLSQTAHDLSFAIELKLLCTSTVRIEVSIRDFLQFNGCSRRWFRAFSRVGFWDNVNIAPPATVAGGVYRGRGGALWAESVPDEGSTFTFSVPDREPELEVLAP